jgi:phosphatidylglycerophosphate synthase
METRAVPDIETLRTMSQGGKVSRDRRLWYVVPRLASVYVTWLLLHTNVSATQVTVSSIFAGLLGAILLAMKPAWIACLGVGALLVHHVLDKVDGEVARFRQSFSLSGVYLDELGHSLTFAGLFLGLGCHLSWDATRAKEVVATMVPAFIGALSMVMVRQNKGIGYLLFARNVLSQPALLSDSGSRHQPSLFSLESVLQDRSGGASAGAGPRTRFLAGLRDFVLLVSEYSFVLLLVLLGLVIELVTGSAAFLRGVLVTQAALQLMVLASLIWINYSGNVRSECLRLNALVREARDDRGTGGPAAPAASTDLERR